MPALVLFSRLGKPRRVEDQNCVGLADLLSDLDGQFVQQRLMLPLRLSDKRLQAVPLVVVRAKLQFTYSHMAAFLSQRRPRGVRSGVLSFRLQAATR